VHKFYKTVAATKKFCAAEGWQKATSIPRIH